MDPSTCEEDKQQENEPPEQELTLSQMLLLLKLFHKQKNSDHSVPYISPRTIAGILDKNETLLVEIEAGLSYLQCIGITDVIDQVLTDNGHINVRKDEKENWVEYGNNLTVFTPRLSFLDLIGFGIETGHRVIIKCNNYSSSDCHFDIFKFLNIYLPSMTAVIIPCDECMQQSDDNEHKIQRKPLAWNTEMKFKLLDILYKKCMQLTQMKPKYNTDAGQDLSTDIILKQLEHKNDNQLFLDLNKLGQDMKKYEMAKQSESEFIKTVKSDWKGKEICNYKAKQITEWTSKWKLADSSVKRKYSFELISVLSQAIKICNGYYPRHTQIIPILISIEYEYNYYSSNADDKKKGILFEIGTGEGKSVVVMLMAAMQNLLFNQKVDIATSQTLLAEREADETTEYFAMLNLGSNGAEYIDADGQEEKDKENRRCSYGAPIIYSTPYNYQCDLLHKNSGKNDEIDCRGHRPFDVNIVDEVDNAFKDLALNSTQLSSPTPGFRDINICLFLIFQRMKMTIISLGMPFVVENALYFMPNTSEYNNTDIVAQYEKSILSSTSNNSKLKADIGTIIANQIIQHYLQNKQETIDFLQECHLINSDFNYKTLKNKINNIRQNDPKLFLQMISCKFIFNISTLIMSQRKDAQGNISIDFHCFFENGKLIKDNISLSDFNGNIAVSSSSSHINWNNLKSLVKADKNSYGKCIKDNVRDNVRRFIDNMTIPCFVTNVINDRLNIWIDSCWRSLFYITEGRDYIIRGNEVCVVDYNNTGCIQPKMHWSNALHEFIQIKHGLKMSTIGTAANIMTNSFYFNLYKHTYGLTGTLGDEKLIKYYKSCFGVDYVRIPSFRKKANITYNNIYCNNYSEWIKMILLSTYSKLQKGCAVLIIAQHIQQVENITKQLTYNNKYYNNSMKKCNKYSRNDTSEKDSISVKLDEGDVIVATNLAGRGTDIKLTKKVNSNGGLHVILTFMGENIRIEKQALGRTARAGNPGSSVIIINKQACEYTMSEIPDANVPKVRDYVAGQSIDRLEQRVIAQGRIEKYYRKFLKDFLPDVNNGWYLTSHDKDQIFFKWALVYNTMGQDMNDSQLSDKYYSFVNSVYSDLGSRSKDYISGRINYNPYYTLINAILADGSRANDLFWKSECSLGNNFRGIGRYFKAANRIYDDCEDINAAIEDIGKAAESFGKFYQRAAQLNLYSTERKALHKKIGLTNSIKLYGDGTLNGQTNFEMKYWKVIIELCKDNIQQLQDAGKKATVSYSSINSAIWDIDGYYEYKTCTVNYYKSCGMWLQLEFEAKRSFWDRVKGFFMALIGVFSCIAGAVCVCFGAVNIGMSLIQSGVDAIIEGVTAMITGQCGDFGEWLKDFGTKLGLSVMMAGIWDVCTPILGAISGVAKTVVSIGKKVIDVGKKLMDNGIFQKIADGKFDLFDCGTLAELGASFIPGDGGKIIKTTLDVTKTAVNLGKAIESGDINDFVDVVKCGVDVIGNDKIKHVGNNVLKHGKTAVNITKNIIDGDINGIIDNVADISSDLSNNNTFSNVTNNVLKHTRTAVKVTKNIIDGNTNAIIDNIADISSDLSNNKTLTKGINVGRAGLKCANNIATGKDVLNELNDMAESTINHFGDEKVQEVMDKYHAIKSGNINNIAAEFDINGIDEIFEYEQKYSIDDNIGGIQVNFKDDNLQNVMMNPFTAVSNLDDIKNNLIDTAFNGCSEVNGFMTNANSLIKSSENMKQQIDIIHKQMTNKVMNQIMQQIGQNEEMQLELKLIGMILTSDYNGFTSDTEQGKKIKEACKTSKAFIEKLCGGKAGEIVGKNKKLQTDIQSISMMIENEIKMDDINEILNNAKIQKKMTAQIKQFIDLYIKHLKDLARYENQVKHWKSKSTDTITITPQLAYDALKENKDWKIEDNFINDMYELICKQFSKEIMSMIEPALIKLFKPDDKLISAMDPTNILNQII